MAGNAGYTDEVNNHYLRIFGSAILMSMITGGMSYSMDSLDSSGGGDDDSPTLL
jgi:type IV secretion system protein VirB10